MSEFGDGYAYCLGLFLAHADRMNEYMDMEKRSPAYTTGASLWFYGASDHLFGLQIPEVLPDEEKAAIQSFQERCIEWRHHHKCTWDDVAWALETAKQLLLKWDLFNGIKAEKGDYQ